MAPSHVSAIREEAAVVEPAAYQLIQGLRAKWEKNGKTWSSARQHQLVRWNVLLTILFNFK